ncbi:MAG: pyridoxine 5'-phosphate synthase [Planctomycetota bacterium]|nr:pyridoxine 5'-phosphate synthase [Planctomycetota bacterium]
MIHLGVNIDHVATVRQARLGIEPDPVHASVLAELGGADGITVHLRADRRHIQERDVRLLAASVRGTLNLEMAVGEGVLDLARELRPQEACLVPEKREELTTEGGLRIRTSDQDLVTTIGVLQDQGTLVSLFIEPDEDTVRTAAELKADAIELHTGSWANAWHRAHKDGGAEAAACEHELRRLERAAAVAAELGIRLHAGHGITYHNVRDLLHLPLLCALNIGHSIVSRAVLVGIERAVRDMRNLISAGAA